MHHHLDFLILGAQKSGTTSLRLYLQYYSNYFFLPSSELHFWHKQSKYKDGNGLDEYFENFKGTSEGQLIGEKCPSYLASKDAPGRLARFFPCVKLLAILRNPADRAYSAYWHGRRVGAIPESRSFSEAIRQFTELRGVAYGDVVSRGFYKDQIECWSQTFPLEQMHFLKFEEITEEPTVPLKSALTFLSEDPLIADLVDEYPLPKSNVARANRFPKLAERIHRSKRLRYETKQNLIRKTLREAEMPIMSDEDRVLLNELYAAKNSGLHKLIGENFQWENDPQLSRLRKS